MPRYAYMAILAVAVFGFWLWQDENIGEALLDNDDITADQPKAEIRRPLTTAEKTAVAEALKTAIHERVAVYKGRVRLNAGILGGVAYVPISLISVNCESFFGIALSSEGNEIAPNEMILVGPFGDGDDEELMEIVDNALDGAEFMDEMCRMVVDELDRLAAP